MSAEIVLGVFVTLGVFLLIAWMASDFRSLNYRDNDEDRDNGQ